MSMDVDRSRISTVEAIVAREHWDPIVRTAMIQAATLALVAVILGMPAYGALTLVHILTLFGAIFANIMSLRLDEEGNEEAAVRVARRSVAALAVSTSCLAILTVMG